MGTLTEAVLTCTHNICFEQKYEKCQKNQQKIVIFTAVNIDCILHGHVFVMTSTRASCYPTHFDNTSM